MVLALGACNPDLSGVGTGQPGMPGGADDEPTAEESSVGTSEPTATTDGGASTSSATTLPPADDTAEGPPMDEGPVDGHPEVTISHGPAYDFGSRNLHDAIEHAFTVTNEGDGDATAVQVAGVGGAFFITGHDCPDVLAPAAACAVQVQFDPTVFGDFDTQLQIAFQDQGMATSTSRPIVGRGVGATGNLLINGGGEAGNAIPPMGWTPVTGSNWSANWNQVPPVEGTRTISAGFGPDIVQFTLLQQVHVTPLTNWGSAAGVRFYYRAFHRTGYENDDPNWVVLRFRDSGSGLLGEHPSGTISSTVWNESVGNFLAPANTHYVQLVLECTRTMGQYCNGFFDGLEVWAEWTG